MSDYRLKLNAVFWQCVKMISVNGIDGEEVAYNIIEDKYGCRSLSKLTTDELKVIVNRLVERTGVKLEKQKKGNDDVVSEADFWSDNFDIDLATPPQLKYIEGLADDLNFSNYSLAVFVGRFYFGKLLTRAVARSLIEALKGMKKDGWKGKVGEPASTMH